MGEDESVKTFREKERSLVSGFSDGEREREDERLINHREGTKPPTLTELRFEILQTKS